MSGRGELITYRAIMDQAHATRVRLRGIWPVGARRGGYRPGGFTMERLARRAGVSVDAVRRARLEDNCPRPETYALIAEGLRDLEDEGGL